MRTTTGSTYETLRRIMRTLVCITPNGNGGRARDVRTIAWEEDLGPAVSDGAARRCRTAR